MSKYLALVNVPGYLPMADEPAEFDSARDAWEYLADERKRDEDDAWTDDGPEGYSGTANILEMAARGTMSDYANAGLDEVDGTGTVHGPTPGYDGSHDLGLAYSVTVAGEPVHVNYPHEPGRLYDCPACEAQCHCDADPGTTECVYSGPHNFGKGE